MSEKRYSVHIEFSSYDTTVTAKNKIVARKKALDKLRKKSIVSLISTSWPFGSKNIFIKED